MREGRENRKKNEVGIPLADNAKFSNYSKAVKLPGLLSLHKDAALNVFISQNRKI